MTLPDMPRAGTRELIEAWENIVVADAISWREEPGDVTLEFLAESVDKLLAAQKAYQEAKGPLVW